MEDVTTNQLMHEENEFTTMKVEKHIPPTTNLRTARVQSKERKKERNTSNTQKAAN